MKDFIELVKYKNFTKYFLSCCLAYIASNIGIIGINWYIIDITDSNTILAIYSVVTICTTIVTSVIFGKIVDKKNKSIIMKICCLLQALLILGFIVGLMKYEQSTLYYLAIVNSSAMAIFSISSRSIINDILSDESLLVHANASVEICLQVGAIFAAGVTGIIYDYYGIKSILYIMIGTLFLSSIIMPYIQNKIPLCNTINEKEEKIKEKREILVIGFVSFLPFIVTLLSNNVLPGYVNIYLNASSSIYGTADMLYGVGALVSGIFTGLVVKLIKKNRESKMFLMSSLVLAFLYFNQSIEALLVLYFLFGLMNTLAKIMMNALFMKKVPKEIYGKSYSFLNSIVSVIQMFVLLFLGQTLDFYGAETGFLILSIVMLLSGLICIRFFNKGN